MAFETGVTDFEKSLVVCQDEQMWFLVQRDNFFRACYIFGRHFYRSVDGKGGTEMALRWVLQTLKNH
jgi:hypothetical protein